MTPFHQKARHRMSCALLFALTANILAASANADALDDAVHASLARPKAPLVPRELMIRRQPVPDARLAPNGTRLAYIIERGRYRQLWVFDIARQQHDKLFTSDLIDGIYWSADSQYLVLPSEQGIAVVQASGAAPPGFVINLDQAKGDRFYDVDHTHPHAFHVSQGAPEGTAQVLYRVLPDGTKTELYSSETRPMDFLTDEDGTIRFVIRLDGLASTLLRLDDEGEHRLLTCRSDDSCKLLRYVPETKTLYMKARFDNDKASLFAVNAVTGDTTLVHTDPSQTFDMSFALFDPESGDPQLVSYQDDHATSYGLVAGIANAINQIGSKVSAPYLILRPSADRSRWLILDAGPGRVTTRYYLYETASGALTRPLQGVRDGLEAEAPLMPETHTALRVPIRYSVSDGMVQQGYVTLPNGLDPSQVPLVVMPHGGPWNRTDGSYSARAQFLANRGYAVFEPNFRASTGFGRAYMVSANRDFGDGRVHADIIDGMNYVLSRGIGDRNRLGMFGHSFGGFSVLGALAFTPELFRVGVAGAPPADLTDAIRHARNAEAGAVWRARYETFKRLAVDPDDPADVARMHARSPARYSHQLMRPLYIWAGEKDPKVSILTIRDYALKQHSNGKALSFMVEPDAGHGPRQKLHREGYFYLLEKALADHLGGRMDRTISAELARYLRQTLVIDTNGVAADGGERPLPQHARPRHQLDLR